MTTPELLGYIRAEFAKGRSKDAIHADLVSGGGWREEDLQEAFQKVLPPTPIPAPVAVIPPVIPPEPAPVQVVHTEPVTPTQGPTVTVKVTMPSVMDQVAQAQPQPHPITEPVQPVTQYYSTQAQVQPIAQPLAQPATEKTIHYGKWGMLLLVISIVMVFGGVFAYAPAAALLALIFTGTALSTVAVYAIGIYVVGLLLVISLFHLVTKLFSLTERSFGKATFIVSLNVIMSVLVTAAEAYFHLAMLGFIVLLLLVIIIQMIIISRAYAIGAGKSLVVIIGGGIFIAVILGVIAFAAKTVLSSHTAAPATLIPAATATTGTNPM